MNRGDVPSRRPIPFLKLHGLGNDFVLIDETKGEIVSESEKAEFAVRACSRHFGIGADGVLFVAREQDGLNMRVLNPDGSEAEMCVNGIRCTALANHIRISPKQAAETKIRLLGGEVSTRIVMMVDPYTGVVEIRTSFSPRFLGKKVVCAEGLEYEYHLVDVGNPHAIAFIDQDVDQFDVERVGHAVGNHGVFKPEGTNVEFVNMGQDGLLKMRVHERGACETLACGSGAIATAFAAHRLQKEIDRFVVRMPGGDLEVRFEEDVVVTGRASLVFEGEAHL